MRDPEPDQISDLRGVLAQVAGQREHRLGGPESVVEVSPGHLGSEPDLERRRQILERTQLISQRFHAAVLDALKRLPVDCIQPGRPVRLLERGATVVEKLVYRQFGERHCLVTSTFGGGSFVKKKVRCSMKHFR